MKFFPLEKSIVFDLNNKVNSKNVSRSFITLEIPKNLLCGIYSVTTNQSEQGINEHKTSIMSGLNYDIRPARDPQSTLVSINLSQQESMKIKIFGSRSISSLAGQ
jgi:predicted signal transduction protein with EAL and GGDEF domain